MFLVLSTLLHSVVVAFLRFLFEEHHISDQVLESHTKPWWQWGGQSLGNSAADKPLAMVLQTKPLFTLYKVVGIRKGIYLTKKDNWSFGAVLQPGQLLLNCPTPACRGKWVLNDEFDEVSFTTL